MKHHDLPQGSPQWHAHRRAHFNASDAPAMLGCSPYKTRAQLLHEMHTGLSAEHDTATMRRFADGHKYEALARPLAEEIIGEDLYPVVGSDGRLSASFDGLTMAEDTAFEHKSLNDELRDCMKDQGNGYSLPKHYQVQMEQQLLVSGAERVLFMASKWAGDTLVEERHCWYASDPKLRAEIIAGWDQFDVDLAAYVPPAAAQVVAVPVMESLPAVSVRMDGHLAVVSNLDAFGTALRAFIARIPEKPSTDDEFALTDAACKALKRAEESLDAAETAALAGIAPVEEMRRLKADLYTIARTTRLQREKLVEARKAEIRTEEVLRGRQALATHIQGLDARLGGRYMPEVPCDFAAKIKGLKTLESVRNAIETALAGAKIAANEIADSIDLNLKALDAASEYRTLFADKAALVLRTPVDCALIIRARITEHKAAEERRAAELAERERAKIRAEEEAKARAQAQREQQEREAAERRQREEQEALERRQRQEAIARTEPQREATPAPAAGPAVIPMPTRAPAAAASAPTLRLGEIQKRIAPVSIDAAGLALLGVPHAKQEGAAKLWHEEQFGAIVDALIGQLARAKLAQREAA